MKLLIPLDGSRFAEAVLEPVTRLVDLKEGQVEVLLVRVERHAAGSQAGVGSGAHAAGGAMEAEHQALGRRYYEKKEYLEGIAERFFPGVARIEILFGDDPAREILALARWERPDLIAMATHGQTGMAGVLMGGVASRLLHARLVPVLLVSPEGMHESPLVPGAALEAEALEGSREVVRAA